MQFIDLLLVRWIFWGQIGHKNYEDFEHPTLRGTHFGGCQIYPQLRCFAACSGFSLYRSRSAEPVTQLTNLIPPMGGLLFIPVLFTQLSKAIADI